MVKNDLNRTFSSLKKKKRKALIAYLAAGYPAISEQKKIIREIVREGADVLELGIPFSDPIADGPTIQFAAQESLKHGTKLKDIFRWTTEIKKDVQVPIVYMTYMNPILKFGLEKFAKKAADAGVSGMIVPDLIPEEADDIRLVFSKQNIHLIHLVAPTTPVDRQKMVSRKSSGFLYAVSVAGVTGARKKFPPQTKSWLASLRREGALPVCVGFGISGPQQIRELKSGVDGFIVGSALIDIIRNNKPGRRTAAMGKFIRSLSKECE